MKRSPNDKKSATRRKLLLAIGSGLTAFAGLAETTAFKSLITERSSSLDVESDSNSLVDVNELDPTALYTSPHTVTLTNQTGSPISNSSVTSQNDRFRFRNPGTTNNVTTLSLGSFSTQQSKSFEIVTGPQQTGNVTDDVVISANQPSGLLTVTRNVTVQFKSGGVLVYAINGSINAYDSVNDAVNTPPQTYNADIIGGNAADIVSGSQADIPYLAKKSKDLFATWVGAPSDQSLGKGKKPKLKKKKTRLALGEWPPATLSGVLVLSANKNAAEIIGVDSNGNTETIATPSNGCGGVSGVADIDSDGQPEMVFMDSSQQLRYLEQSGSTAKIPNGAVGTNNSAGFGLPTDFGTGVVIPFIDGSQNPALVDYQGSKNLLNNSGVAKKAAVAPVDVDADGDFEFMFLGNSSGKIKYIDDVYGSNTVKTFKYNGSSIIPDTKVGLNSGAGA